MYSYTALQGNPINLKLSLNFSSQNFYTYSYVKLLFRKIPLFYTVINTIIFFNLVFSVNYLIKFKRGKVVGCTYKTYISSNYFTHQNLNCNCIIGIQSE